MGGGLVALTYTIGGIGCEMLLNGIRLSRFTPGTHMKRLVFGTYDVGQRIGTMPF